ncbi:MAG: hypothetical protein HOH04_11795 [Rhodospirillaceae bacterium]|nr:hypothetical protein [Rhodospirillaceae bacterium]
MFFGFLALKAALAGGIVLCMSLLAERVSPRVAGIVSGAPLGALISYYMLGLEQGVPFVVDSIAHAIVGMSGVLVFISVYYAVSARARRFSVFVSTFTAILAYLVFALAFRDVGFTIPAALALTVSIALSVGFALRRALDVRVSTPVRMTLGLLTLRAGMAAVLVIGVVSLAKTLGPAWAGLLMGFPMTLGPTILIVHTTYSAAHVHAMLRGFPIGIGSVLCYLVSLPWSFLNLGVHLGTLVSLAFALSYLAALSLLFYWLRRRR